MYVLLGLAKAPNVPAKIGACIHPNSEGIEGCQPGLYGFGSSIWQCNSTHNWKSWSWVRAYIREGFYFTKWHPSKGHPAPTARFHVQCKGQWIVQGQSYHPLHKVRKSVLALCPANHESKLTINSIVYLNCIYGLSSSWSSTHAVMEVLLCHWSHALSKFLRVGPELQSALEYFYTYIYIYMKI